MIMLMVVDDNEDVAVVAAVAVASNA